MGTVCRVNGKFWLLRLYSCLERKNFCEIVQGIQTVDKRIGKEHYNTKPTLNFLRYNIKWVLEFDDMKKELFKELNSYGEKVKIFSNSDEAWEFASRKY